MDSWLKRLGAQALTGQSRAEPLHAAEVEDEVNTCLEIGLAPDALQHIVSRTGLQTIKQINCGANLLQKMQQLLLWGEMQGGVVSQDLFIKEDFKVRRTVDNARRMMMYNDAAEGES